MFKIKSLSIILTVLTIAMFLLSSCTSDTATNPQPAESSVAPPTNVDLLVDAVTVGGGSYALIFWKPSTDESKADFNGYRIITYTLNSSNAITGTYSNNLVPKSTHTQTVSSILRGTRYISYVRSELTDGTKSDSVATKIYGGVYYGNDGVVDEFSNTASTKSGYGWNVSSGAGKQYSLTNTNASSIDMYMGNDTGLKFNSPKNNVNLSGAKTTLFDVVGTGQDAFDQTTLDEPTFSVADVVADQVYLIKTQEGNYIKVWVKSISLANNINTAHFDYKVQPIVNLKLVKK